MNFLTDKNTNSLATILSLLKVRYTAGYTDRYFNEHPFKYSLYGLSTMLTHYGIQNIGIKVTNKKDIHYLETPFIAHVGNSFVAVEKISEKEISYYWHKKRITIAADSFLDIWSGIALIPEADDKSIEPDYKLHKKEELLVLLQKILLLLLVITVSCIGLCQGCILQDTSLILLLLVNIAGSYIGYLLVLKQIDARSSVADKICSLFVKNDCNDVLKSSAAKFMGVIGWSELGLGYFLSNLLILLFAPSLLFYSVFLNIFVLPYSFWSIWYQKFRVKTWCPLCLVIQLLFWLLFVISLFFGLIHIPEFTALNILFVASIYGTPFLLINLSVPYLGAGKKLTEITQQFNSLKMNDKIFLGLLKEQTFYGVDKDVSTIVFGNPNARNTITVFSNPHCAPCANMHKKIGKLLEDTDDQFCVQYILSSFDSVLDSSCEFLIDINKRYPARERNRIYDEWFNKGKYDREAFFKKYSFIRDNNVVSEEYQKHLKWKEKTRVRVTPTVIFEGYELPEMFFQQIERLVFFTDLEVNSK
ncbi:vitamin K epoxide reductase family protein [Bacteroides caccae]|jgi:uncharacterized membrane protein|uniref:vitamin K epoxide reductase family protein n=1 Tax=Bacteroides caccae TaxID=47678 RepID=UPI0032F01300